MFIKTCEHYRSIHTFQRNIFIIKFGISYKHIIEFWYFTLLCISLDRSMFIISQATTSAV